MRCNQAMHPWDWPTWAHKFEAMNCRGDETMDIIEATRPRKRVPHLCAKSPNWYIYTFIHFNTIYTPLMHFGASSGRDDGRSRFYQLRIFQGPVWPTAQQRDVKWDISSPWLCYVGKVHPANLGDELRCCWCCDMCCGYVNVHGQYLW